MQKMIIAIEEFNEFKRWLNFNKNEMKSERKLSEDFEYFWNVFFDREMSLDELFQRFDYAKLVTKIGPLFSWIDWLKRKSINFFFIKKDLTLEEFSFQSGIEENELAFIIRNFLIEKFPQYESYFTENLHVGNIFSEAKTIKYFKIATDLNLPLSYLGSYEDEIMNNLEVVLYVEWRKFVKQLETRFSKKSIDLEYLIFNLRNKKKWTFLRDVFVLLVIGLTSISTLKIANQTYDSYLSKKITLFGQETIIGNAGPLVDESELKNKKSLDDQVKELKDFEKKSALSFQREKEDKEESENEGGNEDNSSVILSSMEKGSSDLKEINMDEASEAGDKGGFRDEVAGQKKVYRVMIKSVQAKEMSKRIFDIVKKYNAESAGDPEKFENSYGGIYYNLYVPQDHAIGFLNEVGKSKTQYFTKS
jgi:hypothetical protein